MNSEVSKSTQIQCLKPVNIMEIESVGGITHFKCRNDVIDAILLHPEVRDRKIVIISIIGEYRKGKSFFLDYCLRFMYANYASISKPQKPKPSSNWMGEPDEPLTGFSWKHGYAADTKGILFWPDVFLHEYDDDDDDDKSGEKIAIIIMDTQGLFEIGSTYEENATIFGLSTLISSVQLFNLSGVIREDQIEYLNMATNLTLMITKKQSKDSLKWKPFQKLLFLIRDWPDDDLSLGYVGGSAYFKDFLQKTQSGSKAQAIRENIHNSFDAIQCFLLCHPGKGVTKRGFAGEWSGIDRDFVHELKFLIESILEPEFLVKKSMLGKDVTCEIFKNYIYCYLDSFRDAKMPEVENLLEMTINKQLKTTVDELIQWYHNEMNKQIKFESSDFEQSIKYQHECTKAIAVKKFNSIECLADDVSKKRHSYYLQGEIDRTFSLWHERTIFEYRRYIKSKKELDKVNQDNEELKHKINKLQEDLEQKARKNNETLKKHRKQMNDFKNQSKLFNKQINELLMTAKEEKEERRKIREILEKNVEKYKKELEEKNMNINEIRKFQLRSTGIWEPWSCDKDGVPEDAVLGGQDEDGPLYIMKAQRVWNDDDSFAADVTGYYSPKRKKGYCRYETECCDTIYSKNSEIEILCHTNYIFVDKAEGGNKMIEGGYNDKGNMIYIARNKPDEYEDGSQYVGFLHNDKCIIDLDGDYEEFNDYEILRLKE